MRAWVQHLKSRQYITWTNFWKESAAALERADIRVLLSHLPAQIVERDGRKAIRDGSPHGVTMPSTKFTGRIEELRQLREMLLDKNIGAITAVHGIAGMGKSSLAFSHAWGFAEFISSKDQKIIDWSNEQFGFGREGQNEVGQVWFVSVVGVVAERGQAGCGK